jgi:RNA polymerase sigma factor (sigma-70 family)
MGVVSATEPMLDSRPRAPQQPPLPTCGPAWVELHLPAVFRFLRALGASRELADDLTQEVFVVAWRRQKQALPPPALATFLRRAARHLWLAQLRRNRRAEAAVAAAAERLWQAECAADDGDRWLAAARACTERLRGRAAEAVHAAYSEDLSRAEIARELGMQPKGVRTLLARTRRWLAECIRRNLT